MIRVMLPPKDPAEAIPYGLDWTKVMERIGASAITLFPLPTKEQIGTEDESASPLALGATSIEASKKYGTLAAVTKVMISNGVINTKFHVRYVVTFDTGAIIVCRAVLHVEKA